MPLEGRITPKTERERDRERGGEKPPRAVRRSVQAGPPRRGCGHRPVSPLIAPHGPQHPDSAGRTRRGGGRLARKGNFSPPPHQRRTTIKIKPNRGKAAFDSPLLSPVFNTPQKTPRVPPKSPPPLAPHRAPLHPHPAARPDPSPLTICFSLGKVSGAILWPTHGGYICSNVGWLQLGRL